MVLASFDSAIGPPDLGKRVERQGLLVPRPQITGPDPPVFSPPLRLMPENIIDRVHVAYKKEFPLEM